MQLQTKEKILEEYRKVYDAIPQKALELDLRITFKTMQALASGNSIPLAQLADIWDMPTEQVQAILEQAKANGQVELDSQGNLVGAILSLNPTDHKISIDNKLLYAWCSWDAIYAPGVLGKPAHIESRDPVTGETIRISITPEGVEKVKPVHAVVSIVGADTDMRAGPGSPRCTQMFFFGSRESAGIWQNEHPGVSILTVEEAFEVAKEFQIKPARRLGLV